MFKLTITDKYNLYKYAIVAQDWVYVESFDSIPQLKLYIKRKVLNIQFKELDIAFRFVSDTTQNVIEFGVNGMFTVSYYDDTIED